MLVLAGTLLFLANVAGVVREHSPHSLPGVLLGSFGTDADAASEDSIDPSEGR